MNSNAKIVHLITPDEIDRVAWHLERKYAYQYYGLQLRERITACHELKQAILLLLSE